MKVGIVGHAQNKFTPETEELAKQVIRTLLCKRDTLISGGCHLGGIDIWAEEIADEMGIPKRIFKPEVHQWNDWIKRDHYEEVVRRKGYKTRNLEIAKESDVVFVLVMDQYPPNYTGRRFKICYHCKTSDHVKSGGCWTGMKAMELYDTPACWIILKVE